LFFFSCAPLHSFSSRLENGCHFSCHLLWVKRTESSRSVWVYRLLVRDNGNRQQLMFRKNALQSVKKRVEKTNYFLLFYKLWLGCRDSFSLTPLSAAFVWELLCMQGGEKPTLNGSKKLISSSQIELNFTYYVIFEKIK